MTSNEEIKETSEVKKNVTEIEYYRPTFWKRVSCIVFDALIFALMSLSIFIITREIVIQVPKYKEYEVTLNEKKIDSGLFVYNGTAGRYQDVQTYLNLSTDLSTTIKKIRLRDAIDTFHTYLFNESGEDVYNAIIQKYDEFRLDPNANYEGLPYFIRDKETGEIVENTEAKIDSKYYVSNMYGKYFDEQALGYFVTYVPDVLKIQKYFSNLLLYLEIPLSLTLGCVIVYYIIPLCFFRNKATLGRFLFQIGLVDKNVLYVKPGLFTIRFLIFLFLEVLLSLFTLGVPLFVSFTLMAFSKKKQNFHDYLLGIEEIDVQNSKIYKSKEEILMPKESNYDFKNFKTK